MTQLINNSQWLQPEISVNDKGNIVNFSLADCFRYHGSDAVGGVVLGFRLLQRASQLLSPNEPIQRHELSVFTSFPGLGVRDVFELVMRMALDNRLQVDKSYQHPDIPAGVTGSFYFRFQYLNNELALAPIQGAPSTDFIEAGRTSKIQPEDEHVQQRWQNEKTKLANQLLSNTAESIIRRLSIAS